MHGAKKYTKVYLGFCNNLLRQKYMAEVISQKNGKKTIDRKRVIKKQKGEMVGNVGKQKEEPEAGQPVCKRYLSPPKERGH